MFGLRSPRCQRHGRQQLANNHDFTSIDPARPTSSSGGLLSRFIPSAKGKQRRNDAEGPNPDAGPKPQGATDISQVPILDVGKLQPKKPKQRTAYRRTAKSDDELRAEKEERAREAAATERRVSQLISRISASSGSENGSVALVLIDAYNAMNADEGIKAVMAKYELAYARAEFEDRVERYAKAARAHCMVIYDAMGNPGPNTVKKESPYITIVYSSRSEADSYIVAAAARYKANRNVSRVLVVSADRRVLDETFDPGYTVYAVDVKTFMQDLDACSRGDTSSIRPLIPQAASTLPNVPEAWRGRHPGSTGSTGSSTSSSTAHQAAAGATALGGAAWGSRAALSREDDLDERLQGIVSGSSSSSGSESEDEGGRQQSKGELVGAAAQGLAAPPSLDVYLAPLVAEAQTEAEAGDLDLDSLLDKDNLDALLGG
mmetsp:Transcript_6431/g.14306  ORF Transcript_6431/g.14306 Transcript_6431/m.14306 type:complete len:432 (+) Transcript_6431:125-1420(+)